MAKKRRQKAEKKEDIDFKFPEFDEQQFISLELRKAKVSLVAFILAIIMVILTLQIYSITFPDARVPMVLGIFGVIAIPYLSKFVKIDTSDFDWKNWVGSSAVYIMSWLALFILLINPPFSDFVEPEIVEDDLRVTYQRSLNETWVSWDTSPATPVITSPIKINFSIVIIDNSGVDKESVKISLMSSDGTRDLFQNMNHLKDDRFGAVFTNNNQPFTSGNYKLIIEAKDINGKERVFEKEFKIV